LSIIRGFAGFCATFDPRTEAVPAAHQCGAPPPGAAYLY
jgi:hypothetical protein